MNKKKKLSKLPVKFKIVAFFYGFALLIFIRNIIFQIYRFFFLLFCYVTLNHDNKAFFFCKNNVYDFFGFMAKVQNILLISLSPRVYTKIFKNLFFFFLLTKTKICNKASTLQQ